MVARRGVDLKTEPQTWLAEVEGGIMERACYVDERPVEGEEELKRTTSSTPRTARATTKITWKAKL